MSNTDLRRRIHRITLPTPFPVGPVHAYLLEGDPLTLVDTGPYTPGAEAALAAGLAALDHSFGDIERIVITHAHSDHFGLVGRLVDASGAQVWTHPLARAIVEGHQSYRSRQQGFWGTILAAAGVPAALAEPTARLYGGFQRYQTTAPVTGLLQDGADLDMAGASWQILHCPGHASNLVCFYQAESRLLIGNDHLLAHISSNAIVEPPPPGESQRRKPLVDYWGSLCRVHELEVDLVLTGHGEAVTDHQALIGQRFRFYEQRLERLRHELQSGPHTVWQLAQALFRHLDLGDTFLACSEIIGHLDVLVDRGEVMVQADGDGLLHYEMAANTAV
jgi:glyoxylase-like metal-dependent hydrolase (beta-lactamase superfamily II)